MKKTIQFVTLILLTVINSAVFAAAVSDTSVTKLLSVSGLNKQLEQLPGTVRAGIMQARQRSTNIPDTVFTQMADIVANSFHRDNLSKAIRAELKKNISESDAKSLFSWYESDAGKKLTKLEEASSTPEAYQTMFKDAQSLLGDEKKVAVAKRIEKATKSVDMAMQLQTNTGAAVYTAILTAADPTKPVDLEPFRAKFVQQEPQIRTRLEQLIILSLVFSYKDADAATMDKYVAFLEKPGTQKFNASIMKGMNQAINDSIDTMVKDLAVLFKSNMKKKEAAK